MVKILDKEFDDELDFKIVGSTEANSLAGKISNESPLGKALLGKKIGETAILRETSEGTSYRKSRHRRIKKRRRYERLAATSQLSLW